MALLAMMSVSACASTITDCPEPTPIDPAVQQAAADELDPTSNLAVVLAAALDDRDKLRACRAIRR